jgi:hypothetical protein
MVDQMNIILDEDEALFCHNVGLIRQTYSMNMSNKHGMSDDMDDGLKIHILGAGGEMAFCKAYNIRYLPKINTFGDQPDVDPDIEVKTGSHESYRLMVRPSAKMDHKFNLVLRSYPHFIVCGWIFGYEAEKLGTWESPGNRPGAWFVKRESLKGDGLGYLNSVHAGYSKNFTLVNLSGMITPIQGVAARIRCQLKDRPSNTKSFKQVMYDYQQEFLKAGSYHRQVEAEMVQNCSLKTRV